MINFQDNSDQYSLEQYDDSNVYYDEFQEHPAKDCNENSHIITISRTNHSQSSLSQINIIFNDELEIADIVWVMIEEQYKMDHHFIFIYRYNKRRRKKKKLQQ